MHLVLCMILTLSSEDRQLFLTTAGTPIKDASVMSDLLSACEQPIGLVVVRVRVTITLLKLEVIPWLMPPQSLNAVFLLSQCQPSKPQTLKQLSLNRNRFGLL